MNTLTAIIVDDEEKARNMLQMLFDEHCPDVNVLAHCKNVPEAVAAINLHKPQLVFLDVDMPGYTGFQLLDFFKEVNFEIIFTTAHSEYAVQAFRVSAIDFLLKPIDIDELITAVEKSHQKKQPEIYNRQLNLIRTSQVNKTPDVIAIHTSDAIEFIKTTDIIYLEADRAYTKIFYGLDCFVLASKNIKEFEELFANSPTFFRSHRSFIINLKQVVRYNKLEGGFIEMSSKTEIPLSKDAKPIFIQKMEMQ